MKDKYFKLIVNILFILLVFVFIVKISPVILQNDTLYDIKLGERYLNEGMFRLDDYSIHEGLKYQTHHYLVSIISYLVYDLFSYEGLYMLELLLVSIIAFLFYLLNKTFMKDKLLIYLFLFIELFALLPFISLRAQMYSYIIFMIEILFIERYLNTNKPSYLIGLTLLPFLLINLHSGVIYFYYIIIGTYLLNIININYIITNDKRMTYNKFKYIIITIIISLLLTLINPYNIDALTYGLKTLDSSLISNYINEFQPLNISTNTGITSIFIIFIYLISLIKSKKNIKIHELLLFIGTIYMTFTSIRHFSLFIITSVVVLRHIEGFYRLFNTCICNIYNYLNKGINIIVIFIIYLILLSYLIYSIINRSYNMLPTKIYPVNATKYIKDNKIEGNIFNRYNWGSYLMFNDIKVFIDSRCDLYTPEYNINTTVMQDYIDIMNKNKDYKGIVFKYKIKYFLLHINDRLVNKLNKDENYKIIYMDNTSVIIKNIGN